MLADLPTIEIVGSEELQKRLEGIERATRGDRLVEPWERATEVVMRAAEEKAPNWRGVLKNSIDQEVILGGAGGGEVYPGAPLRGVTREDITGVVYSDEFYAPFQERGTDPYFPNVDALEEWADDHDITAYGLALIISGRGITPRKFFEEALIESEDAVFDLIGEAIAEIMEKPY